MFKLKASQMLYGHHNVLKMFIFEYNFWYFRKHFLQKMATQFRTMIRFNIFHILYENMALLNYSYFI